MKVLPQHQDLWSLQNKDGRLTLGGGGRRVSEKWIRRAYGTTYDVCQCLGFWFFLSVAVLGQDQPTRRGEMRFNSVSGFAPIAGGPIGFVSLARDPVLWAAFLFSQVE